MTTRPMHEILDDMLAQRSWVEGLCRSLVRDPAGADDLVQETWLSALRRRSPLQRPQAWLAKVARNHARMQHRAGARRQGRERHASRADESPSTAEVVAAFDVQRQVAAVVHELAEPFRTTVLLHHFEGLSLAAIARRQQEPEGTVRWRLFRAHELLRERLHGAWGDDWRSVLLPFCGIGPGRAVLALASLVLVLAGVGLVVWSWPATVAVPANAAAEAGAAASAREGIAGPGDVGSAPVREAAAPGRADPSPASPSPAAVVEPQSAIARATIVDESGEPIAGAKLQVAGMRTGAMLWTSPLLSLLEPPASSDATGRAALVLRTDPRLFEGLPDGAGKWVPKSGEPWSLDLEAVADERVPSRRTIRIADGDDLDVGVLQLRAATTVRGRVLDRNGAPLVGAKVAVFGAPLPEPPAPGAEPSTTSAVATTETASFFGRGSFALHSVPRGPVLVVASADGHANGHVYRRLDAAEVRLDDLVLAPLDQPRVASRFQDVRVVDAGDAPIVDALIYYRSSTGAGGMCRSMDGGTQRLWVGQTAAAPTLNVCAIDSRGLRAPAWLVAMPTGDAPIVLRLQPARPTEIVVRSAGGRVEEAGVSWAAEEPALGELYVPADDEGRHFAAAPPFAARIRVSAKGHVDWRSDVLAAGAWPERLVVDLVPQRGIHGLVRAGGRPVAQANVLVLEHGAPRIVDGFRTGAWSGSGIWTARTDERGEFRIDRDKAGEIRLRITAEGRAPYVTPVIAFDPALGAEVEPVDLTTGGRIRGHVVRGDGTPAGRVRIAAVSEDHGASTVLSGRDGAYEIPGLAAADYEVRIADGEDWQGWSTTLGAAEAARPWPFNAHVDEGRTTDVDLVQGGCRIELELAGDGAVVDFDGWTAQLRFDHDGAPALPTLQFGREGRTSLVVDRPGSYVLRLEAPGGEFGDLSVTRTVAVERGSQRLHLDLPVLPFRTTAALAATSGDVWLDATIGGLAILAKGRFDERARTLAFALAPRGRWALRQERREVGTVDVVAPGEGR